MANELVKRYTTEDNDIVCEFIKKASGIETVNEEILTHSVLIKEDEEIIGMVSYERFDALGIVRYFIYNQQVKPDLLVNMFFELYASAKGKGINQLISVANQPYACQLLELLGFSEIRKPANLENIGTLSEDNMRVLSIKL